MKPHRPRTLTALPLGDTDPYVPSRAQPVRCRARSMALDTHLEPHEHDWAQLACCARGLIRVSVSTGGQETSVVVTPERAVWIPPRARHAVSVVEAAELRTLYIDASACPPDWRHARVLEITPLLRALMEALDPAQARDARAPDASRRTAIMQLVLDELAGAAPLALGVPLPAASADRRLRHLCEAVLGEPAAFRTLAEWAAHHGASERTMARLFREQLGIGFQRWRQQAVLARALPLLARGLPVGEVAAQSGYASESAFSAMFKAAMGVPPRHFRPGTIAA